MFAGVIGFLSSRDRPVSLATREGHAFADSVFGDRSGRWTRRLFRWGYVRARTSEPVGLTEPEARQQHRAVDTIDEELAAMRAPTVRYGNRRNAQTDLQFVARTKVLPYKAIFDFAFLASQPDHFLQNADGNDSKSPEVMTGSDDDYVAFLEELPTLIRSQTWTRPLGISAASHRSIAQPYR
jgi:hypothetical protein